MKKSIIISISCICLLWTTRMAAQEDFIGEIRMFAGNFAPRGWAFCDGQLLAISQNDALFSIIGTTYGGDGVTTFALPDLRGRLPVHKGQGAGLTNYTLGEKFGQETVTLVPNNLPPHTHPVYGVSESGTQANPAGNFPANSQAQDPEYAVNGTRVPMNFAVTGQNSTSNAPVNNRQPSLGVNYIICLYGIYPSRN